MSKKQSRKGYFNMRDIKRIDKFCKRLAEAWKKVPDWRFGQLMSNILGEYYSQTKMDPFFVEDDEFIEFIEKYLGVDGKKDEE